MGRAEVRSRHSAAIVSSQGGRGDVGNKEGNLNAPDYRRGLTRGACGGRRQHRVATKRRWAPCPERNQESCDRGMSWAGKTAQVG